MKRIFVLLVLLMFAPAHGGAAQEAAQPALPPAAQDAFDKGVIAAQAKDFLLAFRYFDQARKAAPDAPAVWFNLGLAEANIPGRELRAICWLAAYLAANPNAPNAAAVRQQILELDVRSQSNLSRFLRTVQEAVNKEPGDKSTDLDLVAQLWIRLGDSTAAQSILDLSNTLDKLFIGEKLVGQLDQFGRKPDVATSLALGVGDELCNNIDNMRYANAIAEGSAEDDDVDGALTVLTKCRAAKGYVDAVMYNDAWQAVAEAQLRKRDLNGAKTSLAEERKYTRWDAAHEAFRYANDEAAAGNFSEAQTAINAFSVDLKSGAEEHLMCAQAVFHDVAGAQRTAAMITDPNWAREASDILMRLAAGEAISFSRCGQDPYAEQRNTPAPPGATEWIARVTNSHTDAKFLDLAGTLQSNQPSDPHALAFFLEETAQDLVDFQLETDELLARKAKP